MFSIFPTLTETETDLPLYNRVFLTETGERVEITLDGTVLIVRWDDERQFVRLTTDGRCEHTDLRPTYGPRRSVRSVPRPRTDRVWVPDGHGCGDWEYV
jgi:hypothetical protein